MASSSVVVRTRVKCNCDHPLSTVTLVLDSEAESGEGEVLLQDGGITMTVGIECPRCRTRAEASLEPDQWEHDE